MMKQITIHCGCLRTRAEFHTALADALAFPAWYGRNLDALHDLLTQISEDTALTLTGWLSAKAALGSYGTSAENVFIHAAGENAHLHIVFA